MMTRALEKVAEPIWQPRHRVVVCHRCGAECAVSPAVPLETSACPGCVQRLEVRCECDDRPLAAVRTVASRPLASLAADPWYGVVDCAHCDARCIVEVGEVARTACGACLRPLGSQPLLRIDCHAVDGNGADADFDELDGELVPPHQRNEDSWMWLRA